MHSYVRVMYAGRPWLKLQLSGKSASSSLVARRHRVPIHVLHLVVCVQLCTNIAGSACVPTPEGGDRPQVPRRGLRRHEGEPMLLTVS